MPTDVPTALFAVVSSTQEKSDAICLKLQGPPLYFTAADMADINKRLIHCTRPQLLTLQLTGSEWLTLKRAI